jgi:hypothetical protein
MRPKDTQTVHFLTNTLLPIMTKQVMLSMLEQGNTGAEILSILNVLTSDKVMEETVKQPTADPIEF